MYEIFKLVSRGNGTQTLGEITFSFIENMFNRNQGKEYEIKSGFFDKGLVLHRHWDVYELVSKYMTLFAFQYYFPCTNDVISRLRS